ncbi:MAG TPA: flagellar biosynthetic protein FliO [Solirubrobacteraceae bacterium]|nr:flagellar biosynthetic protein FliO [Solirubrobacteraceae bacterium]
MLLLPALVRLSAVALSGVLLAPALALAADGEQTPLGLEAEGKKQAAENVGASGGNIVRTIVGLAVVIGVIYGLTWVLKQVKTSKQASAQGAGLTTLATLPLGTNRSLHLVRAGGEIVLVGAGEHGVTPIRTYTEDEARRLGLLDAEESAMAVVEPDVFGKETRRGRFVDELRKRTVIK